MQAKVHMGEGVLARHLLPAFRSKRDPFCDHPRTKPPPGTLVPDDELVNLAKSGDRRAFRLLVERHKDAVGRTVLSILGRTAEVDDVAQETFIRFYRTLDRFRGDSSVSSYLKRIAINAALDVLRRRRRLQKLFVSRDDASFSVREPHVDEERRIETRDRARLVHEAIERLPPNHRAVVVLRLVDGHSTEETANILGIAYGTVLSRLSRAIKRLKDLLDPILEELQLP